MPKRKHKPRRIQQFNDVNRFFSNVERGDGHWFWTGYKTSKGLPTFFYGGRRLSARRVAWELARGDPLPKTESLIVTCSFHECINPEHLEVVPALGMAGQKNVSYRNRENRCYKNHKLTPENVYLDPRGKRRCRTCQREAYRRHRKKRAALRRRTGEGEGGGQPRSP